MAELIRVLIVDRLSETHDQVTGLLASEPNIQVVGWVDSAPAALQASIQLRPDVILLDNSLPGTDAVELTERLGERAPGAAVVMTSTDLDGDYVRRAMVAGARGFMVKPLRGDELLETVRRIQLGRDRQGRGVPVGPGPVESGSQPGRVVAVFAAKGGVGRTTLAVNLAVASAPPPGSVALVDASVQFGDVGLLLDLKPASPSIADLIGDLGEGFAEAVNSTLVNHPTGVHVLLAPPGPETAELITPDHYLAAIDRLKATHQLVVVDCGPLLQDVTLAILDAADVILCVTSLDLSSIKSTRLFMVVADRIGYGPDKLRLVLNRSDSPHGIDLRELEQSIGRAVDYTIVSDGRAVLHALNTGVPFTANNKAAQISQDVTAIAAAVGRQSGVASVASPSRPVAARRLSFARR